MVRSGSTTDRLLRERRLALGLTMRQAAVEMGVTVESVHRWEYGLHVPRGQYLPLIAAAYQLDLDAVKDWAGRLVLERGVA